jgi:hypothetical protein
MRNPAITARVAFLDGLLMNLMLLPLGFSYWLGIPGCLTLIYIGLRRQIFCPRLLIFHYLPPYVQIANMIFAYLELGSKNSLATHADGRIANAD